MASESVFPDQSQSSLAEFLRNTSGGGIPLFLPFLFGVATANPAPDQPGESREQFFLINALTQTMVVVEDGGESDATLDDLLPQKSGRRPASKESIDAMPTVEVENCDEQCAVCLEEYEGGETAKEMPCKHRFHGGCIERWLNVSGSCPVCRYEMPQEEKNRDERERRRGVWVSFSFGGGRRSGEDHRGVEGGNLGSNDSSENRRETED